MMRKEKLMKQRRTLRTLLLGLVIGLALFSSLFVTSAQIGVSTNGQVGQIIGQAIPTNVVKSLTPTNIPKEFDVRGPVGVPHGLGARKPTDAQLEAFKALESAIGAKLQIQYNGLTATPHHLFSYG